MKLGAAVVWLHAGHSAVEYIFIANYVRISPQSPRLCGASLERHFVQRRFCAGFDPLAARESRLPNLVVRLSLAQQPGSRQESETRNERRLGVAESAT